MNWSSRRKKEAIFRAAYFVASKFLHKFLHKFLQVVFHIFSVSWNGINTKDYF